jgi:hypothetical protein
MSTVYRDPQSAYATFDFTGSGKIALKDILNHQVIKKMDPQYTAEDVKLWLYRDNVFENTEEGIESEIGYGQFKKYFFPALMQILDNEDIQGTPGQQWESNFLNIGMEKKI